MCAIILDIVYQRCPPRVSSQYVDMRCATANRVVYRQAAMVINKKVCIKTSPPATPKHAFFVVPKVGGKASSPAKAKAAAKAAAVDAAEPASAAAPAEPVVELAVATGQTHNTPIRGSIQHTLCCGLLT